MYTPREVVVGITCLVVGSVGQLAQLVVTPLGAPDDPITSNVARAVAAPSAMQLAAWLDLTILFFLPALVVVAGLAGARTTRLGWTASVIAIGTTLPGIAYVLVPDVLYSEAAHGAVSAGAIEAYQNSAVVSVATLVFLVGHVVGLLLLGIALWRARSVPRWAGVCLALSPFLEIGGTATGVRVVAIAAYLLLIAAFGACAAVMARSRSASPLRTPSPVPAGS